MEYKYKAIVVEIYDGDSVTVDIDLGFNNWIKNMKLRLYGVDTPELRGDERSDGLISKQYMIDNVLGKEVIVQTIKDKKEKYGRYLAVIWLNDININEKLLEEGLAEPYIV